MTEKELNNLSQNVAVIHRKYQRRYLVRDKHLRMKNPTTGEWVDAVTYVPLYENNEKLFCREKTSFLEEFDRELSYCEKKQCKFFINGVATCEGAGC